MNGMLRCYIGVVLGIYAGILGILASCRPLLNNLFAGYFFEYAAWGLAVMISCSAIIGAVLAYKGKIILGGYLMLFTSLIWMISLPLQFVLPLSGIIGIMSRIFFTLYTLGGVWPILSLIGGILILSAKNKPLGK
jgi:hypothetical protein